MRDDDKRQPQADDIILPAPIPPPARIRHPKLGEPSATWVYRDAAGAVLFTTCRFDPADSRKQVLPFCATAKGWRWKASPAPRPLYGLDRLSARPDAGVLLVEGEKTADAAATRFQDFVVATWCGGCGQVRQADLSPLKGRDVTLWPDADAEGEKAMAQIADTLREIGAASVRMVKLPAGMPDKWDLADPLPGLAWTDARLRELLDGAKDNEKPKAERPADAEAEPGMTDAEAAAEIRRLAALDPLKYERQRKAAAKAIGTRATLLDKLVIAERPKPVTDDAIVHDVAPWPDDVVLGDVLDDIAVALERHVVLPNGAAAVLALWIAHTWTFERFEHTPRLMVTSALKRSGKSTLMEVVALLSCRVLSADSISAPSLYRTVEAESPVTLILDEADTYLPDNEPLRGVLNSGFQRNGKVVRIVERNGEQVPTVFRTFAPVAIAAIGDIPGTVADRSIPIAMRRRAAGETAVKLRAPGARVHLRELARKLARWSRDGADKLSSNVDIPATFGDREGDICIPLLSIAEAAGGHWPARARDKLTTLFGIRRDTEANEEVLVLLLRDVRDRFDSLGAARLPSQGIVDYLKTLEGRPWPEYRRGQPITTNQLAALLRPLLIVPTTLRLPGSPSPAKGYYRDAWQDAWDRYLGPPREPGEDG
jgi:hypothetical protein